MERTCENPLVFTQWLVTPMRNRQFRYARNELMINWAVERSKLFNNFKLTTEIIDQLDCPQLISVRLDRQRSKKKFYKKTYIHAQTHTCAYTHWLTDYKNKCKYINSTGVKYFTQVVYHFGTWTTKLLNTWTVCTTPINTMFCHPMHACFVDEFVFGKYRCTFNRERHTESYRYTFIFPLYIG